MINEQELTKGKVLDALLTNGLVLVGEDVTTETITRYYVEFKCLCRKRVIFETDLLHHWEPQKCSRCNRTYIIEWNNNSQMVIKLKK